jgi:hypothetical protein
MFNSKSNVRLNEWFHQNKYPHQKLQVGCQLLGWQVIEIKGHIRGSSEPYLPDDGQRPHPGKKTRLLTITNGRSQRRKNKVPEKIRSNLSVNTRCSAAIFSTADV